MSAPSPTARQVPVGYKTPEGFSVHLTMSEVPDIQLWEVALVPPGVDNGSPIKQTTQFNRRWHTYKPHVLNEMKPIKGTFGYDPDVMDDIFDQVGREQTFTYQYPEGSTMAFFGYLKAFEPKEHKEGEMPTADCEIMPTMVDPESGDEADPVFAPAAGT